MEEGLYLDDDHIENLNDEIREEIIQELLTGYDEEQ
jgi:hypothetical protein